MAIEIESIFQGIFDIMAVLAQEWIRADYYHTFGYRIELATRIITTLTGTNLLVHVFCSVLMTLNRYTAACRPIFHQEFWTDLRVKCLLIVTFILSYLAYLEWFLTKFLYKETPDGWRMIGRQYATYGTRLMGALVVFICEFINIILITCTVLSIRRQRKTNNQRLGQELSLVVLTAITCPVNLLEGIYDFSFLFEFESPVITWMQNQRPEAWPVSPFTDRDAYRAFSPAFHRRSSTAKCRSADDQTMSTTTRLSITVGHIILMSDAHVFPANFTFLGEFPGVLTESWGYR
ncbi:hypothetical protein Y032_0001g168 [Ancylostoma ceylanicum]|uniref:Serpentine receptor class gamma n=1 Tax=Ancylostoma ceylanicum TaxID=53326 RepID=A0A016W2P8_9BILA|nr:hypothetical protein Y032_0001g168 [Ancylostoma ceylanicum]